MNLIKRLSAFVIALTISAMATSAHAEKKMVLDILVPFSKTGNGMKTSLMFKEALEKKGVDIQLIHTANCFQHERYLESVTRPSFYWQAGSDMIANAKKGCVNLVNEETYIAPHIYRSNAVCVRRDDGKGETVEEILAWIGSQKRVTVAATADLPDDFKELSDQFGNTIKKVEYKGSSKVFAGMMAGDTDLVYTGYTKREINAPNLNCFATTDGVNGTAKFSDVFPDWNMSRLVAFNHLVGAGMDAKQKEEVKQLLIEVMAEDPKISSFYGDAFIATTADLEKRGMGLEDFWADVEAWNNGQFSDKEIEAWKKGKLN